MKQYSFNEIHCVILLLVYYCYYFIVKDYGMKGPIFSIVLFLQWAFGTEMLSLTGAAASKSSKTWMVARKPRYLCPKNVDQTRIFLLSPSAPSLPGVVWCAIKSLVTPAPLMSDTPGLTVAASHCSTPHQCNHGAKCCHWLPRFNKRKDWTKKRRKKIKTKNKLKANCCGVVQAQCNCIHCNSHGYRLSCCSKELTS